MQNINRKLLAMSWSRRLRQLSTSSAVLSQTKLSINYHNLVNGGNNYRERIDAARDYLLEVNPEDGELLLNSRTSIKTYLKGRGSGKVSVKILKGRGLLGALST